MAYTAMVAKRCGINIAKVVLLLVSRDYRLGMENKFLFSSYDYTEEVLSRREEFRTVCAEVDSLTSCERAPQANLKFECRKCPAIRGCLGGYIDDSILDLPRLSRKKFEQLQTSGIVKIRDIPADFSLTPHQQCVRNSVSCNRVFVGPGLPAKLNSLIWPAWYLDFETTMIAIPLYGNLAPYAQIPTQFSALKCKRPGCIAKHFEYLADPSRDCRREFAEKLIAALGREGSVFVYSGFENRIISELADLFPDLASDLSALKGRLVDLERIIRTELYHPAFHGKTAIKRVLPALVPELSYDDLEIRDGDTAMTIFAEMALGRKTVEEMNTIRKSLLQYCRRDTEAMVELHRKLLDYSV